MLAARSTLTRRFGIAALTLSLLAGGGALITQLPAQAAETAVVIPPPAVDESGAKGKETALLAGGCFWGVQGVYQHVKGVENAVSGYAGGAAETATYEKVSTGQTGHAETVAVTYDPQQITYGQILQIYFSVAHDPTTLNRQGPDHGTQYRSAIFPTTPQQKAIAEKYIAQLNAAGVYGDKIVTKTDAAPKFYPAEGYHQDFLAQNPSYPYIVVNDQPKIDNLKQVFPQMFRADPVLVAAAKS
jgi:peptide-methionine (S)-S-oxide reductase